MYIFELAKKNREKLTGIRQNDRNESLRFKYRAAEGETDGKHRYKTIFILLILFGIVLALPVKV